MNLAFDLFVALSQFSGRSDRVLVAFMPAATPRSFRTPECRAGARQACKASAPRLRNSSRSALGRCSGLVICR